jgi:hypothetical protein
MNLKSYIAPVALTMLTVATGFYLLLGPSPVNNGPSTEVGALDTEVMRYFSVKADQYAKEAAEANGVQSSKKADQI